jgi:transposase
MEACVGAHHLSRTLKALGHDARLMPAKYVRPYSKGQKNDYRDAETIAEAVQRPTMKFVATKTADQLDLQALHRVRERFVGQRTGIINQIRAFMLERGIAVRQGLRFLRAELPGILATRTDVLSPRMLRIIEDLAADWRRLDMSGASGVSTLRRSLKSDTALAFDTCLFNCVHLLVSPREVLRLLLVAAGRRHRPDDHNRCLFLGAMAATQPRFQAGKHESPL